MFGHDTVEQILETARTSGDDWAVKTAAEVEAKSPTSLKVTLAALRGASTLDSLEDCLTVEFRIISRMFHAPDFREGVRAAVIDKDQSPRWQPAIPFRSVGSRRLRPLRPARPQGTGPDSSIRPA